MSLWGSECIPPLDLICMARTGCWKEEQGLNYPVTLLNLSLWMEREWNVCLQGGAEWELSGTAGTYILCHVFLWHWAFLLAGRMLQRHVSILLSKCAASSICKQGSVARWEEKTVLPQLWWSPAGTSTFPMPAGCCKLNVRLDSQKNYLLVEIPVEIALQSLSPFIPINLWMK